MSIELINLAQYGATFKNSAVEAEDKGDIGWSIPVEVSPSNWKVFVTGSDVSGHEITGSNVFISGDNTPSPSQVFSKIAQVLKALLCPHCV